MALTVRAVKSRNASSMDAFSAVSRGLAHGQLAFETCGLTDISFGYHLLENSQDLGAFPAIWVQGDLSPCSINASCSTAKRNSLTLCVAESTSPQ